MKQTFFLFIFGLMLGFLPAKSQNKSVLNIPLSLNQIDGDTIQPGDTLKLLPGNRSFLLLKNIQGTSNQPVIIINKGGASVISTNHYYGIKFSECSHIKLLGNGHPTTPYGIKITQVLQGAGITIDDRSTDVELAYVEITNTKIGGIYAKTDPTCSFLATRDKFTMYNLHIHHCYVHDIPDEGMYVGSSKYTGQYLPGCDTTVLPHLIYHVSIHNNIIERSGWDGIQVSSASIDCHIFDNIVRFDSQKEMPNQMSGILIGGGSNCDCYNNSIFDGKGDGIDILGFGEMKIYNNLIVRQGRTFQPTNENAFRHGIFIGNAPDNAPATLKIMHNTIISPKSTGIRFLNQNTSSDLLFNNIVSNPGSFAVAGNLAYFDNNGSQVSPSIKNNIFTEHPENVGFINYLGDNYDLKPGASAVNSGFNAGLNKVTFDLLNRPRPHNAGFDIGAFESQDPYASVEETPNNGNFLKIFPVPSSKTLYIDVNLAQPTQAVIYVFDATGKLIEKNDQLHFDVGSNFLNYNINNYKSGTYILHLHAPTFNLRKSFTVN
jgi:hypothetical protein